MGGSIPPKGFHYNYEREVMNMGRRWLDIGGWDLNPNSLSQLFEKYGITYRVEVTPPHGECWFSVFVDECEEVICNDILSLFIEL